MSVQQEPGMAIMAFNRSNKLGPLLVEVAGELRCSVDELVRRLHEEPLRVKDER